MWRETASITVEIEDQSGSPVGKVQKELQQSLIRACQLLSEADGCPKQNRRPSGDGADDPTPATRFILRSQNMLWV
jgi:hypothetical protein